MSNWVSLFYILFLLIFGDIADILHLLSGVIRRLSVSASFASASFDSLFENHTSIPFFNYKLH